MNGFLNQYRTTLSDIAIVASIIGFISSYLINKKEK